MTPGMKEAFHVVLFTTCTEFISLHSNYYKSKQPDWCSTWSWIADCFWNMLSSPPSPSLSRFSPSPDHPVAPPQHGAAASVEGGRNDCQRDSKSSVLSLEVAAGGLKRDEAEKIAHP